MIGEERREWGKCSAFSGYRYIYSNQEEHANNETCCLLLFVIKYVR